MCFFLYRPSNITFANSYLNNSTIYSVFFKYNFDSVVLIIHGVCFVSCSISLSLSSYAFHYMTVCLNSSFVVSFLLFISFFLHFLLCTLNICCLLLSNAFFTIIIRSPYSVYTRDLFSLSEFSYCVYALINI